MGLSDAEALDAPSQQQIAVSAYWVHGHTGCSYHPSLRTWGEKENMNVTVTGIPWNTHLLWFILCEHMPVGMGRGRKNTRSVVAINYLTQLQLNLLEPNQKDDWNGDCSLEVLNEN